MAVFKCKMCGGALEVAEGMTVCECEYCGTQQTLPKNHDDVLTNLFNRANNLRSKSEFDKAQDIYEKIVAQNPNEAEAYWGIILCKFGIEYVEDPTTYKKIPTCHRTQLESVKTDADYQSALENADAIQRTIYEREATEIDRLQKDILAIVHKEKPFDVFICYKETDENGNRTQDSVIANDIYYQLTQEGFKVFYAAITLEDKLGQAYEPYIFAALNSAKVMLVLGTKPEYFNAVWVRNEWNRYLKIVKKDRSKLLIPCYRDMDAYDLPDEFSHLQAQDMSKIGFITDIIRGIRKMLVKDTPAPATVQKENVIQESTNANIVPLLKRTKIFLEEGEWQNVKDYCNRVLDMDPENGQAYLYAFLSDLKVHSIDELPATPMYGKLASYKRMKRFADDSILNQIKACNQEWLYRWACSLLESQASNALDAAEAVFILLGDYSDSTQKIEICKQRTVQIQYNNALNKLHNSKTAEDYREVEGVFDMLGAFSDAPQKAKECAAQAVETERKDQIYHNALNLLQSENLDERKEALDMLCSIPDHLDSAAVVSRIQTRIIRELRRREYEQKYREISDTKKALYDEYALRGFFAVKRKKEIVLLLRDLSERERRLNAEYSDVLE